VVTWVAVLAEMALAMALLGVIVGGLADREGPVAHMGAGVACAAGSRTRAGAGHGAGREHSRQDDASGTGRQAREDSIHDWSTLLDEIEGLTAREGSPGMADGRTGQRLAGDLIRTEDGGR
jgi:hypothetical protein